MFAAVLGVAPAHPAGGVACRLSPPTGEIQRQRERVRHLERAEALRPQDRLDASQEAAETVEWPVAPAQREVGAERGAAEDRLSHGSARRWRERRR